jgi:hypothetical protein
MNLVMLLLLILIISYGFAWHDRPANAKFDTRNHGSNLKQSNRASSAPQSRRASGLSPST